MVNGFFRLADGRGYMKVFVECAITWERLHDVGLDALKRNHVDESVLGTSEAVDHTTVLSKHDKRHTVSGVSYLDSAL